MTKVTVKAPRTFSSRTRGHRQSAQKARLVIDLVRGKTVGEALNILRFTPHRAAQPVAKTIKSAAANAVQASNRENLGINEQELVVCEATVDQGMSQSRWRPRSRGMANPYVRYYCHIEVALAQPKDLEALKLYRQIRSQKRRVDRIADLKGLEKTGNAE